MNIRHLIGIIGLFSTQVLGFHITSFDASWHKPYHEVHFQDDTRYYFHGYFKSFEKSEDMRTWMVNHLTHHHGFMNARMTNLRSVVFSNPQTQELTPMGLFKILKPFKRYNYVINDHSIVFTRTTDKFSRKYASKHVFLSNGCEQVRLSGEFRWDPTQNALIINNNSGSYRPSYQALPAGRQLFINAFGLNDVQSARILVEPHHILTEQERDRFYRLHQGYVIPPARG